MVKKAPAYRDLICQKGTLLASADVGVGWRDCKGEKESGRVFSDGKFAYGYSTPSPRSRVTFL
jgi:hypothetical protein